MLFAGIQKWNCMGIRDGGGVRLRMQTEGGQWRVDEVRKGWMGGDQGRNLPTSQTLCSTLAGTATTTARCLHPQLQPSSHHQSTHPLPCESFTHLAEEVVQHIGRNHNQHQPRLALLRRRYGQVGVEEGDGGQGLAQAHDVR